MDIVEGRWGPDALRQRDELASTITTVRMTTDKIEPALTAEEWAKAIAWPHGVADYLAGSAEEFIYPSAKTETVNAAALIALANAALPDGDPRKITRAWIDVLRDATVRDAGGDLDQEATEHLERIADALGSYLKPESPK